MWFSTHACHKRPWGQRGKKWTTQENPRLEQASSSVPQVKEQTDLKSSKNLEASPATRAHNPLSMQGKMKKIVVWLSTASRVSWLQVWKQMHLWPSLPISTSWRWEETQREVEVATLKEKKVQGCVSQNSDPMNSISRKAVELGLNASAGHTLKFSGRTWYETKIRERKRVIWRHYPKTWTSWAKSLRVRFWGLTPEETSRQADCASKPARNLARKTCKLKAEDKATFYSPVERKGARNTEGSSSDKRNKIQCKIRHVDFGILAYVITTSLRLDAYMEENVSSDMLELIRSPEKKTKRGGAKGSVASLKESAQLGCVSQDS